MCERKADKGIACGPKSPVPVFARLRLRFTVVSAFRVSPSLTVYGFSLGALWQ
jgi:hypothetical protein